MTQPDKSKESDAKKTEGAKSVASSGKGREGKDERLPGPDEWQGGKPYDKVRGGRT